MAKISKFPSSSPLATQSKNTEIEELRHPEVIQDPSRSQLKISKIIKNHQNLWKFSQNLTKFWPKCQNFDQFRQFWSHGHRDPRGTCQAPSAIASLFREISIWALSDLGRDRAWTPKLSKTASKWPKSTSDPQILTLTSNFDPWDQKFDLDPQILTPKGPKFSDLPDPSNFDP